MEPIGNMNKGFVSLLRFALRRDEKYIFASDSRYLVEQAIMEKEEIEKQGWALYTYINKESQVYQVFICMDKPLCKTLVKARINQKMRECQEKYDAILAIYEKRIKSFEEFKGSL
jgi:hypothetical protein